MTLRAKDSVSAKICVSFSYSSSSERTLEKDSAKIFSALATRSASAFPRVLDLPRIFSSAIPIFPASQTVSASAIFPLWIFSSSVFVE